MNDRPHRRVFIRDLELEAFIGVNAHEKVKPQRILIGIELLVREEGEIADDIRNVVSYSTVIERIKRIVAQGHVHLVETLAERIAQDCLADDRVVSARIRVEKPDIIPNAASVGVEIERRR
jgi:7,8-dihydroneopterin aldolase/epimerase/oxygenase